MSYIEQYPLMRDPYSETIPCEGFTGFRPVTSEEKKIFQHRFKGVTGPSALFRGITIVAKFLYDFGSAEDYPTYLYYHNGTIYLMIIEHWGVVDFYFCQNPSDFPDYFLNDRCLVALVDADIEKLESIIRTIALKVTLHFAFEFRADRFFYNGNIITGVNGVVSEEEYDLIDMKYAINKNMCDTYVNFSLIVPDLSINIKNFGTREIITANDLLAYIHENV